MKITVKQIKFIQIDTEISSTLYILRIFGDKITVKKLNNKNNNIYKFIKNINQTYYNPHL